MEKKILLLCLIFFSFSQTNIAQCTNPKPTGSDTQTFCKTENKTVGDLIAVGGNIVWYNALTGGVAYSNLADLNTGEYYAEDKFNGNCSERLKVDVSVFGDKPIVNLTISVCKIDKPTVSNLFASGENIEWYDAETGGNLLAQSFFLQDGGIYWAQQTENGCVSKRAPTEVTLVDPNAPTVTEATQTFCEIDKATVSDLEVQLDQASNSAIWYSTETSTVPLDSTEQLVNGVYWGAQKKGVTCESTVRSKITVIINSTSKPIINAADVNQEFCVDSSHTVSDLQITGTAVKWYATSTSTTALAATEVLVDGMDYYATQTDSTTGCESSERTKISVVIGTISIPTSSNTAQTFCASGSPTLNDLEIVGTNIKWYNSPTSTTVLDINSALENGTSYYATQSNSAGCESDSRLQIDVLLTEVATPTLNQNGEEFCILKGNFTLSDLNSRITVASGNTVVWYDDFPNGNTLSLSDVLVHNTKYYAVSEDVNGCASINALEVMVNLEACKDEDLIMYDGFSPNNDGINDVFSLKNIELLYPNYTIGFYNRWGNIVYAGSASKPYWNGELDGDGKLLPKGIYYYILDFRKDDKKPQQGTLYLSR